jgi:hypothetical protein
MGHKTTGLIPGLADTTAGLPGSAAPIFDASCMDEKKGGAAMRTIPRIKRSYIKIKQQTLFEWICESLLEMFYICVMLGGMVLALYWIIKNI